MIHKESKTRKRLRRTRLAMVMARRNTPRASNNQSQSDIRNIKNKDKANNGTQQDNNEMKNKDEKRRGVIIERTILLERQQCDAYTCKCAVIVGPGCC